MDEIVEASARVFHDKGYDAGSLDDVATALDLRKASLYYYVPSKAELLYRVFDRALTMALEAIAGAPDLEDPRERLAALVRDQARTVALQPSLFTVLFDERGHLAPAYEPAIQSKERQHLHAFVAAVEDAVEDGILDVADARYGAQAILGMTSWAYKWFEHGRDDAEAFARTCVGLLLGGPGDP